MQSNVTSAVPTGVQWRMVLILCLVNAVAFIDRNVLPLLVQPIKRDLSITDTEMSFLIGAAFVLPYFFITPLVGSLVDKISRRKILATGITLWGAATMFCGAFVNYTTLFVGRLGVATGETVSGPAALSLIRDVFDAEFRGRAIGVWSMGASVGGGLALLGGGMILLLVGDSVGSFHGWQVVLITCGLLSLPIAVLVFTFPEPKRRPSATGQEATVRQAFDDLRSRWMIFVPLFIANGATIMLLVGYSSWVPAFLGRTWHIPPSQIGFALGLIILFLSTAGQFLSGFVIDFALKRLGKPGVPLVGAIGCVLIAIPAVVAPFSNSIILTWTMLALFNLLASALFTVGTATMVHVSPSTTIGKISGIHFSWVGITGYALAPTFVAVLADKWFGGGSDALVYALATAGGTLAAVGGLSLITVFWQLKRNWPATITSEVKYAG